MYSEEIMTVETTSMPVHRIGRGVMASGITSSTAAIDDIDDPQRGLVSCGRRRRSVSAHAFVSFGGTLARACLLRRPTRLYIGRGMMNGGATVPTAAVDAVNNH